MLDILYRDSALIAIHKPAGLLVHRSELDRHETRFAVQLLRDQIGQPVWPVHRLDRGTSGVLLFALDRDTLAAAGQAFERDEVDKTYVAIVRGWPQESGSIDHALTRQYDDYELRGGKVPAEVPAQDALTRYTRLAMATLPFAVDRYPSSRYALLRLHPQTGRRHQIRRHLKHIAHPIIGDATYGKGAHNRAFAEYCGAGRLLLACTRLTLAHPHRPCQPLVIDCPLEDSFARVVTRLGWSAALAD